jgi:hypothetical protein
MKQLSIDAASPESASEMVAALSSFRAELVDGPGGPQVIVALDGNDADIVAVLNALQQYVTARADGPARVELDEKQYVMHPEPDQA